MAAIRTAASETHIEILEDVLYEELEQEEHTYSYYQMMVTDAYFDGGQHLAIKVMADSFGSDPDVFISRSEEKPDASNAEWHCERAASETCILHDSELDADETPFRLYIAVQCVQACSYKLRAWYFEVLELEEAERTQLRLGAYTT